MPMPNRVRDVEASFSLYFSPAIVSGIHTPTFGKVFLATIDSADIFADQY